MSEFKAIAAVAENGVIGSGLSIPWHISEDFKHFKKTTLGGIVAMGRRTWESLGCKPLPNRENVVITSRPEEIAGGARAFRSLDELARFYADDPRTLWIIGGAKLYETALDLCSELVISRVKMSPRGDVFFPKFDGKFEASETILSHPQFDVVRYVRRK